MFLQREAGLINSSSPPTPSIECKLSPTGKCDHAKFQTCGGNIRIAQCRTAINALNSFAKDILLQPAEYCLSGHDESLSLVAFGTFIFATVVRGDLKKNSDLIPATS